MSGQTAADQLPYPTGTDLVRDGDNAIQALAQATDDRYVWHENIGGGKAPSTFRVITGIATATTDTFGHMYVPLNSIPGPPLAWIWGVYTTNIVANDGAMSAQFEVMGSGDAGPSILLMARKTSDGTPIANWGFRFYVLIFAHS